MYFQLVDFLLIFSRFLLKQTASICSLPGFSAFFNHYSVDSDHYIVFAPTDSSLELMKLNCFSKWNQKRFNFVRVFAVVCERLFLNLSVFNLLCAEFMPSLWEGRLS